MRARLLLTAGILSLASSCGAVATPIRTGDVAVDTFLADLEKGDQVSALARLGTIESASGLANAIETPQELIEKLSACELTSAKQSGFPPAPNAPTAPKMYETGWKCPDGEYYLLLDPEWRAPKLTVGQFELRSALQRRLADRRAPAPPASSPRLP